MEQQQQDKRSPLERALAEDRARLNSKTGEFYETTSWAAVDLGPYIRGEQVIAPPRWLRRTDGRALIYPGRPHSFFGPSETLKSFGALVACRDVTEDGLTAIYVDMEGSEASFVERCRVVGIADRYLGRELKYVRPTEPLRGNSASDFWLHEMEIQQPALVVLDGVTELYALQEWDVNRAEDAAKFQQTFAFRGLCASIAIDHTAKDAGRGQLGSQHKRAGLDGAEYEFKFLVHGGINRESVSELHVTKDRHGRVREWTSGSVGKLHVVAGNTRLEGLTLQDLGDPRSDAQDRALEFVKANPGCAKVAVREGARLGTDEADEAVGALLSLGKIRNAGSNRRYRLEVV
jgi:AAA domain